MTFLFQAIISKSNYQNSFKCSNIKSINKLYVYISFVYENQRMNYEYQHSKKKTIVEIIYLG
jgi:hypothetical protein